jgi:hypothetical protein
MEITGPDSHRESPQNTIAGIVSEGRSIGKEDSEENEMPVNLWRAPASIVACARDGSSMRGTVGREPKAHPMSVEKIEIFSRSRRAFAADFVFEGRVHRDTALRRWVDLPGKAALSHERDFKK